MNICMPVKASCGLSGFGPSKTQKHLAKFADINYMIERALGGDSSVFRRGAFADVTIVPDNLQDMLNAQCKARDAYESLPAAVRKRFPSPEFFLQAIDNPDCKKELLALGVLVERKENEPIKVSVVNPVTPAGGEPSTGEPAR